MRHILVLGLLLGLAFLAGCSSEPAEPPPIKPKPPAERLPRPPIDKT